MKRAGVKFVNVGLESGSERVRNEILRRPKYTNEDIVSFSKMANQHGIDVSLYVLVGLPGETLADFLETVACARECRPKYCLVSIFFPYPGTDLYKMAMEMGLLGGGKLRSEGERTVALLDLPGFSRRRIRFEYIIFYYRVYRGRWPFWRIFFSVCRHFVVAYPRVYHAWRYFSNTTAVGKLVKRALSISPTS
jgi:radical SAM superfamily enzyme YgiQ (UPF0313 family)